MSILTFKHILTLSALCVSSAVAHASATEPTQTGPWVGGALGLGYLDEQSRETGKDKLSINGLSLKIDGGYDFYPNVGVYASYDSVQYRFGERDVHMGTVGLKGKEQIIYDNLYLFGKLGAAYPFNEDNENGFLGIFGVGLEYQLTNAVSTRIGVDHYSDLELREARIGDLTQYYWGMTYRFGQPTTPYVITETVEVVKEVPVEVEVVKEVQKEVVISSQGGEKLFSNNSSLLLSTESLKGLLQTLQQNQSLTIEIEGHTDSVGSKDYNQWMSERRARSVAKYFEDNGIAASRIHAVGKGEREPIASNNHELGRAQNRRVELTIR